MIDNNDEEFEIEDVKVIRETDKALRIEAPLFDEGQWVPKSVITNNSEVWKKGQALGSLVVNLWFAEKKEWLD